MRDSHTTHPKVVANAANFAEIVADGAIAMLQQGLHVLPTALRQCYSPENSAAVVLH